MHPQFFFTICAVLALLDENELAKFWEMAGSIATAIQTNHPKEHDALLAAAQANDEKAAGEVLGSFLKPAKEKKSKTPAS
jgi:DNA-binding GntR family transcriptional regulator